jgi:hypothetical protein
MSMKFTRKDFFQSLFGGFIAAVTVPSITKAEQNTSPEAGLAINPNGNLGIGEIKNYYGSGKLGTGTAYPDNFLHVTGIIFHVGERKLEMSGHENGGFQIKWIDLKDNEYSPHIYIEQPKIKSDYYIK